MRENIPPDFFSQDELLRYMRHFTLPHIGLEGQKRLKSAKVLCVGAGGLGSPVLLYLCAAGVGTLGIVDDDTVDLSNLQRQILYTTHDLQQPKTTAAHAKLAMLNPNVHVITHNTRLTKTNACEIIGQYDFVVDGTDNFTSRYLVNDACFQLKKPNIYASIFQFTGQCSIFTTPNGPCYRCLYDAPPPPGLIPDCREGGVFGVLPGLLGTLQATEVLKLILNIGHPLIGRLLTIDALSMRFEEFKIQRHPDCRLCHAHQPFESLPHHDVESCSTTYLSAEKNGEAISVQQLQQLMQTKTDFVLLDVREPYEYAICHLGGLLIPLSDLPNRLSELDSAKLIVIHCKTDPRSQRAVQLLKAAGFKSVQYLKGGISAWTQEIDPTLPIY